MEQPKLTKKEWEQLLEYVERANGWYYPDLRGGFWTRHHRILDFVTRMTKGE